MTSDPLGDEGRRTCARPAAPGVPLAERFRAAWLAAGAEQWARRFDLGHKKSSVLLDMYANALREAEAAAVLKQRPTQDRRLRRVASAPKALDVPAVPWGETLETRPLKKQVLPRRSGV